MCYIFRCKYSSGSWNAAAILKKKYTETGHAILTAGDGSVEKCREWRPQMKSASKMKGIFLSDCGETVEPRLAR